MSLLRRLMCHLLGCCWVEAVPVYCSRCGRDSAPWEPYHKREAP